MCFHCLVYIVVRDWSPGFQAGGVVGDEAGAPERGWMKGSGSLHTKLEQ